MENFRRFVEDSGAFLNTDTVANQFLGGVPDGATKFFSRFDLPTPTLELPTIPIKGKISNIVYTKTPIEVDIQTDQGTTKTYLLSKKTWDEFKKHNKEPKIGNMIEVQIYLNNVVKAINIY